MKVNACYSNLPTHYLFHDIDLRVKEYLTRYPNEHLLRMGIGDVTRPLPRVIVNAMQSAAEELAHEDTFRGYCPENGYEWLQQCVINNDFEPLGIHFHTDEIFIGEGAGSDLGNLSELFDRDNKVAILDPTYPAYVDANIMAGREIILLPCTKENAFVPDLPAQPVDIIYLCFPNNPTGAVMTREDLEPIAKICIKHNLFVVSDEIYSELTYTGEDHVSIVQIPHMQERTILINGFSKAFAMTGWRLGYCCGPAEVLSLMTKIHQYAIMCAPTNSQYAAIVALRDCYSEVEKMREAYNQRRRFLLHSFEQMGLPCFEPFGAFYVFPCIKEFGMTSEEFATRLLEEERVAVVPGDAFGESGEGFIRISYAYSLEALKIAIGRLEKFIERLRRSGSTK